MKQSYIYMLMSEAFEKMRKAYMHDYCVKRYAEQKQMEAESLESLK